MVLARRGAEEAFVPPSRAPRPFGERGPPLSYVVLGDSTGAGRGAPYEQGIAVRTARHLARDHRVTLTNLAESGARLADVERGQAAAALRRRPDLVLLSAGANDVTGLTSTSSVERDVGRIAERLRADGRAVPIVVTASPDMGAVPRLAQPLRAVVGLRTRQVNAAFRRVVARRGLTLAPIAAKTGARFREDPSLFAADRFHPDAAGYATWVPVLEEALDRALGAPR